MNERKITHESLDRGPLRETLDHHMHLAEISDNGRERINDAMKAAIEHVAKKQDLRYGVGGNHIDEAAHFLESKYEGRHDLKPKERELIESTLKLHFHISDEKEAA